MWPLVAKFVPGDKLTPKSIQAVQTGLDIFFSENTKLGRYEVGDDFF